MRWLITNRSVVDSSFGSTPLDQPTYWLQKDTNFRATEWSSWSQVSFEEFRDSLVTVAATFPHPRETSLADQKHVTLLIHGYNNSWADAMSLHEKVERNMFSGDDSLGICISFDWPSKGCVFEYLPDRAEARKSAAVLEKVLSELYDWMSDKQIDAAKNWLAACRARTSIIAHSMGNYLLESAMNDTWTRKNRPLLVSLVQELLMVAADVDNDLFRTGETISHGDGEGIANLSYRVTALYTGRDDVLGASAGLKHFGKRRLGRSGLDGKYHVPDNVWDIDCSSLINADMKGFSVHGAYFNDDEVAVYKLMRGLLQGQDRSILIAGGLIPLANPKQQLSLTTPVV